MTCVITTIIPWIRPLLKNEGQGDHRNPMGEGSGGGSGCAGLFRCGKGTTWEGGQRVPGLISYPSKIEPGTSHALTSALDILPTFMSMAGEDVDQNGVGYDISDFTKIDPIFGTMDDFVSLINSAHSKGHSWVLTFYATWSARRWFIHKIISL